MAKLNNTLKGQLHQYFQMKIGAFDYRNGWMKSRCPYCNAELKFGINIAQDRTNCFKCGSCPNPLQLVMFLEDLNTFEQVKQLLSSGKYEGYQFKEEKVVLREQKELGLPGGFRSILLGQSQLARSIRNYLKGRGFNLNDVAQLGWGYGTEGKYFGYVILPFMRRGEMVYFNARNCIGSGPKYINPENDESGVGKSMVLYNQDALDMYNTVFLCEGVFNAVTMGVRGISSSGKAVSKYQINLIIRSSVQNIVILLDPDAKQKALEVAFQLVDFKRVKVVYLPDGTDCNDLGKKFVMQIVRSTPYHTYRDLLRLKDELK